MAKRTPEYRDLQILSNALVWRDRRNGASALSLNTLDGVCRADLNKMFKVARGNGMEITSKRPLLVYGTVCPLGETETFTFQQMTPRQIADLDEEIYAATSR